MLNFQLNLAHNRPSNKLIIAELLFFYIINFTYVIGNRLYCVLPAFQWFAHYCSHLYYYLDLRISLQFSKSITYSSIILYEEISNVLFQLSIHFIVLLDINFKLTTVYIINLWIIHATLYDWYIFKFSSYLSDTIIQT